MIKIIKNIKDYFKKLRFAKQQQKKLKVKGSLLHAFSENKRIFIHIPKTAGISIAKAIFGDVSLEGHRSIFFYQKVFEKEYTDFFTFTFVRNPWDRLYSSYKFLEKGGINIHDKNAYEMYLSQYHDFEDFVLNGLDNKLIYEITHFIPQSEFICNPKGEVLVDFLGKFENLEYDIKKLSEKINKEVVIEHHNKNKKKPYIDVYTNQMKLKVEEIYQRDIDIFKYRFK